MTLPEIDPNLPIADAPNTCIESLKTLDSNPTLAAQMLDMIRKLTGDPDYTFGEFKPCTLYNPPLDMFEYLEKDCSYTSQYIPGSNIELLWDNHPDHGGKLVGVKINQFSLVAPAEVIRAYHHADGLCVECGRFQADPPSRLCPVCEAYQEHTR